MKEFKVGDIVIGLPKADYYAVTAARSISIVVRSLFKRTPDIIHIQLLWSPKGTNCYGSKFAVDPNKFRKLSKAELVLWKLRIRI